MPAINVTSSKTQEYILSRSEPVTESGCWLWTQSVSQTGYGWASLNGRTCRAHRLSYAAFIGPVQEEDNVLHRCDVPECVNPSHLFLGSDADNMRDKVAKGRCPKGETHGNAKLTARNVIEIRQLHATGRHPQRKLARDFKVSQRTIQYAIRGKNWGHVQNFALALM